MPSNLIELLPSEHPYVYKVESSEDVHARMADITTKWFHDPTHPAARKMRCILSIEFSGLTAIATLHPDRNAITTLQLGRIDPSYGTGPLSTAMHPDLKKLYTSPPMHTVVVIEIDNYSEPWIMDAAKHLSQHVSSALVVLALDGKFM